MNSSNTAVAIPQLTLAEAVLDTVNELKGRGSFSAHDVTAAIRADANAGDIALPGHEAQGNKAGIKYWVEHNDVKDILEGLLNDGTLATLGLTHVGYNGTFRTFEFGPVGVAAAPVAPNTAAAIVPVNNATATVSPVLQRIQTYLGNNPGVVTLKQIQSAIKVNGLSCKDFFDILTGAGYTVNVGVADKFSTYTVG